MGLIHKVRLLKKKNLANKGLLNKCLEKQNSFSSPDELDSPGKVQQSMAVNQQNSTNGIGCDEAFIENMQARVLEITGGIESPAYLFRFIYESIPFKKGALFLIDHYNRTFSPFASINWFRETEKKLAFPLTDCEALLPLPESGELAEKQEIISIPLQDGDSLFQYKLLFTGSTLFKDNSSKLNSSDTEGELVIKPFYLDNRLVAFLIVGGIEKIYISTLDELFTPFAFAVIKGRLAAMEEVIGHMPQDIARDSPEAEQEIKADLKISYDLLLTTVLAENNLLYPAAVRQDILLVLGNLFHTIGRTYKSAQENILFLKFNKQEEMDEVLLVHQCYYTLHTFFKVTKSMLLIQTGCSLDNQLSFLTR
jgi:hypothetical protein